MVVNNTMKLIDGLLTISGKHLELNCEGIKSYNIVSAAR